MFLHLFLKHTMAFLEIAFNIRDRVAPKVGRRVGLVLYFYCICIVFASYLHCICIVLVSYLHGIWFVTWVVLVIGCVFHMHWITQRYIRGISDTPLGGIQNRIPPRLLHHSRWKKMSAGLLPVLVSYLHRICLVLVLYLCCICMVLVLYLYGTVLVLYLYGTVL